MMTKEQSEIVKMVYNRFFESEGEGWSRIDDNLELLQFLSDKELISESKILYKKHSMGVFRCTKEHDQASCFAPYILEAVEAIISIEDLHPKNAYILTYYIAMSELNLIYSS